MFLIDAHLDLALNAIEWNRDLTKSIEEIREGEKGMTDKPGRADGTVNFVELRRAGVGLVVATQIARVKHKGAGAPVWGWGSPAQAWAMTQGQLAWYRAMTEAGEITPITSRVELDKQVASCSQPGEKPKAIGFILSLEGADSLITLGHLERAYGYGLRAVGPAHYGDGIYAQGTNATGGLHPSGRELLAEMDRLGMILDLTHLTDEGFWEALKIFKGPVWASHQNCRALVPHQRQLNDDQIRAIIERDGVIGAALDGWMIVPDWIQCQTRPEQVNLRLENVVTHIDHICQIAGNAKHVGLGSDMDGGFGREQTPTDVDTIADMRRLPELLIARRYSKEDAERFANGNFLRVIRRAFV